MSTAEHTRPISRPEAVARPPGVRAEDEPGTPERRSGPEAAAPPVRASPGAEADPPLRCSGLHCSGLRCPGPRSGRCERACRAVYPHPHPRPARVGFAYVAVLSLATFAAAIALGVTAAVRSTGASGAMLRDAARADALAESVLQYALETLTDDANWRQTYAGGGWQSAPPQVGVSVRWRLYDPIDGSLTDDTTEPVHIVAEARVGDARRSVSAVFDPILAPLDILSSAVHSSDDITIPATGLFEASNQLNLGSQEARVSANDDWDSRGLLIGSVQAVDLVRKGAVTGSSTRISAPKRMPPADLFARWAARATATGYHGDVDTEILAPGYNTYGGPSSPAGIYLINSPWNDVTIRRSRLVGTLLIDAPGRTVRLRDEMLLQTVSPDRPVLMIRAARVVFDFDGRNGTPRFRESDSRNLNPPGVPYNGSTDNDTSDGYPSLIEGLVHVIGDVELKGDSRVNGVLIVDGDIVVSGSPTVSFDPAIRANPPDGYLEGVGLKLRRGGCLPGP